MKAKNVLLFLTLLFFSISSVIAQGKCKYVKDEIDPISGKQHRTIGAFIERYIPMVQPGHWILWFERLGDDFTINSDLVIHNKLENNLEKGDSLIIKLENGKLLRFYASIISPRQNGFIDNENVTIYKSFYPIKVDDLQSLSDYKAVFIRIYMGALHYDREIKDKNTTQIQSSVKCILK